MPENVVIDIDTFEIVDDGTEHLSHSSNKWKNEVTDGSSVDNILWEVTENGVTHILRSKTEKGIEAGNYCYWQIGKNGDWGHSVFL